MININYYSEKKYLSCSSNNNNNKKKINVLTEQLQDNGVVEFDPKAYLEEISNV